MASVSGGGSSFGSGRKRSLDAEINLVPFIDLLSMCICFLLMTAVWTQLGSVQVKQSHGTDAASVSKDKTVDLELKFNGGREAVITLKKSGKIAKTLKLSASDIVGVGTQLQGQLQSIRQELSKEGTKVSAVFVTAHDQVDYGSMVSIMDVFRKNEMTNIGVVYASR
jgi:biopolymer transport protein TolR